MAPDADKNGNEKSSVHSFEVKVKRSSSDGSSVFDEEEDYKCGWGKFTPSCLQFCNNAKGFLVAYCFFVIIQGSLVNGFVNVSISTLERRFGLTSSETGVISTGYDIAFCVLTMFVTYFGSRSHRPRWVGIGCFIMGVGALVFSLPHFTTPNYEYAEDFTAECIAHNGTNCDDAPSSLHDYVYVFILGQLLHGVGCTPLYTLGLSFIEDSVPKESAAVYLGIGNAASIFGPVLGYGLGGLVLTVWVDFDTVDESLIEIDTSDPRWVGAWWLGIICAMACAFLLTVPLLAFPRDFPGAGKFRALRESEVYNDGSEDITEKEGFGRSYKDFPIALWTLLKNPTYVLTSLAGCSEAMVISGFTTFLPKIIENLYQLPAGDAAIMAGIISIPGGIVGHILAGVIVQKFNLKTANILKFSAVCCVLVCAGAPVLFLYCPNQAVSGITYPYLDNTTPGGDLIAACNANCTCQGEYYIPVCGADKSIYFTACHAGCTTSYEINSTTYYKDCSCISNTTSEGWQAVQGLCPSNCNSLGAFLGIFFVVVMFTFMSSTPALVVTFRIVPASMRSFAIGVQWLFIRALGSIPGPILFGFIIDFTCILWQTRECDGSQGACWIYDSYNMAINVLIISCVCKLVSATFFSCACYFYKPPPSAEKISETELKAQTDMVNEAFENDLGKPEENGVERNQSENGDSSTIDDTKEPVTVL